MTHKSRRCLLFVPGNKPERFGKALAAGADVVCIDLEDAVLPSEKVMARNAVLDFLENNDSPLELAVRINRVNSDLGIADLQAIAKAARKPDLIMLPKVEGAEEIETALKLMGDSQLNLIALIESPMGLLRAEAIAAASQRTVALMFGGADFSAELGGVLAWEPMYHARSHLSTVAAAYHLDVIDVPYLAINDNEGLGEECQRIKTMGFTCKSAIHPAQVAAINNAFSPTPDEVEKAQRIVTEFAAAQGGAVLVDGKFVDRPIVVLAERVLAINAHINHIES